MLQKSGELNGRLSSVSGGACGSWKTVGTGAVPGQSWRGQLLLDRCLLTRHGRTRNVCCVPEDGWLCCYLPACVRVSTMLVQCCGTSRLFPPHTSLLLTELYLNHWGFRYLPNYCTSWSVLRGLLKVDLRRWQDPHYRVAPVFTYTEYAKRFKLLKPQI